MDESNKLTVEEASVLQDRTVEQHKSRDWHSARAWRITSSRFGDIISSTSRRNIDKLCESLLHPPALCNPPVLHGRCYESLAAEKFEELTGLKVIKCGIFVNHHYPFLASSPDGLVGEDSCLEIKCPFSAKEMKIVQGKYFPFLTKTDNELVLKQNHKYFYQIQGQMGITGRKSCYFVVYTHKDILIQKIP